ncbi:MAG: hypothetical protein H6631_10215 [Anaerolineaceae bacterium]|nr:hypothetical protein [Anaerolineaceae bacterium]
MELYKRQQFEFLLVTAVDRYIDRLIQRNQGAENALAKLRNAPQGDGIWLDQFVDALFEDFLLNNIGGACFILQALAKQVAAAPPSGLIETVLVAMARDAFGDILRRKTEEVLEQQISMYGGG